MQEFKSCYTSWPFCKTVSPTVPSTPPFQEAWGVPSLLSFFAQWEEYASPRTTDNWRRAMEKTIARWSYWLGIACVFIVIAWKGGNALGLWRALPPTPADISYWSFFNAGLLFFATSIASACRVWLKSIKDAGVRRRPMRKSLDRDEPETADSMAA